MRKRTENELDFLWQSLVTTATTTDQYVLTAPKWQEEERKNTYVYFVIYKIPWCIWQKKIRIFLGIPVTKCKQCYEL